MTLVYKPIAVLVLFDYDHGDHEARSDNSRKLLPAGPGSAATSQPGGRQDLLGQAEEHLRTILAR